MERYIPELMRQAKKCECGNHHHPIPIEKILVGNGALGKIVSYLKDKSYNHAVIIADHNTFQTAGKSLSNNLSNANITFSTCLIQPDENNDVIADEISLVQAILEISRETDVLIAIGAGTLHDITRFCGAKMGIPFISVPTAPSVDGFTSMGAPIIVKGVKKTFQMTSPIAVFADLEVLKTAPKKMIAAGFGDMIAKYTSLADWKFGHLTAGESYCPLVAQITQDALESTVNHIDKIAKCDEEGTQILIEGLIKSGLAMLIFGQSHPASGGEHHLSHYWEMEFLRRKRPAVLHGAKVGVSTSLLADIYQKEFLSLITDEKWLEVHEDNEVNQKIRDNLEEITEAYREIPNAAYLREQLAKIGGETEPEHLGIDEELVKSSLAAAHHLRDRFTALKFMNEIAKVTIAWVF